MISTFLILGIGATIGWVFPQPKFATNALDTLATVVPGLAKYRSDAEAVDAVAARSAALRAAETPTANATTTATKAP